jgi:TonB-linked SusC/RagA family outer membrane protein
VLALLLASVASVQAQQQRITGRVTATGTGDPLPGVQIVVQGTKVGVVTNGDGRYLLTAPSGTSTLVFTLLGYSTKSIPINGQSVIDTDLEVRAVAMNEIVVIGYGQKSKANVTEAVSQVTAAQLSRVSVASPEAAIEGHASGILVTPESGIPGAPVSIRIRGVGTVGNAQPLFIVDGLPVGMADNSTSSPLGTLNPSDIESISVLKDASAAAIYGVQAANGVVLIKTKRGALGKPTITYNAYTGIQNFPKTYQMLSSQQWYDFAQEAYNNYNTQHGYKPGDGSYQQFKQYLVDNKPTLVARNTDWMDVITNHNAPIMNQDMSVSGATDRANYYVSGGFFKQNAIVSRWDMKRYSFRANSDFKVSNRIRAGENFALSNQHVFRGQQDGYDGQLMPSTLTMPPFFQYADVGNKISGNRYGFNGNAEFIPAGMTYGNEAALNQIIQRTDRTTRALGGLYAEVEPLSGLVARSQASLDYSNQRNSDFNPSYTVNEIGLDRGDYNGETRQENTGLVWTNTLNYSRFFGRSNVSATAGAEMQKYTYTATTVGMTNCLTYNPAFIQIATACTGESNPPSGWAGETSYLGYIGRLNYNYADRYLLTASVRRDGASTFAPENRWGTFPSVSAGWRISQEPFFKLSTISDLKLRAGWGRLGNSTIPGLSYPHLFKVTTTPNYGLNGSTVVLAPVPQGFVNPNVIWESSETLDGGFDVAFLDNALTFSAGYYRRDTKNFLVNVPLTPSSGFSGGAPMNSGLVRNAGLEFESGYNTRVHGVDLTLNGNLTTVKNRLVSLAPGISEYAVGNGDISGCSGTCQRTAAGYPIGYLYGYKINGIYQTDAEAAAAVPDKTIGNNHPVAGDIRFVDVNGRDAKGNLTGKPDGKIDADDRTYLGKTIPDFFYGFNVDATWHHFDVGTFFSGVSGVQKLDKLRQQLENVHGGSNNRSVTVLNHWTPSNHSTTIPRNTSDDLNNNDRLDSQRWVENASYLRMRNLQLGYTLPKGYFGTTHTRVYVSGTNLFTITPYKGLDPEFTTSIDFSRSRNSSQLTSGIDTGNLPLPRIWQIGVSTSF